MTLIRAATNEDLPRLQAIERAAGEAFRGIGMAYVADDEPPSLETLRGYAEAGQAWVAEHDGEVAAYLLADVVDGNGHVEQVSVHPGHAGHGLGRALIEHVARRASEAGLPTLTLTTYRDVPWNAPYYARLGFTIIPADELTPELHALCEHEATLGLDFRPRVAMRRRLDTPDPGGGEPRC